MGQAAAAVEALVAEGAAADGTARAPSEAGLINQVRARVAAYKAPKRIFFVDELPRNTMGKVQKNRLRETYARAFAAG